MKHLNKLFVVFLTLALLATAFTGCKGSASSGDEGTKFTVTFDPDGGSAVKAQSVKEGAKAKEPAAPTKEGLEFEGWFIGDTEYDFSTKVTADITLKAKWYTAYTVTFDPDGGSAVQAQKVKSDTIAKTPTPPTKQGLEFEGWFIGDTAYDFSTAVTANITLKAKWYKAYTITFNSDGGSPVTAIKVKEGTCATAPAAPTKDDYEFSYWINADSTPYTFTTPVTADITLKAIWTIKKYVVTFMSDDWTTFDKKTVNAKETVTKPASSPTLDGYTFIGWCLDNEDYDFSTPVTASITLKAKWLDVNATISMVKNVTEENIVDTILTLQTSQTLKVTGSFDNYKDIADALIQLHETSPSVLVRLDLSATTGCSYIFANGYHNYGFYNCENLETIILPDSIISIGENTFCGCKNLTSITIPDSVTSIGKYAFYNCYNLSTITLPAGITSMGTGPFMYCNNLKEVYYKGTMNQWLSINYNSEDNYNLSEPFTSAFDLYINNTKITGDIILPDGITSIRAGAFCGCTELTSITIPDSVTSIGDFAFSYCKNLNLTIPDTVTSIGRRILSNTYKYNGSDFDVTVTINKIYENMGEIFDNSKANIILSDDITEIPSNAFNNSSGLILTMSKIPTIASGSFNDARNCKIILVDGITEIPAGAFRLIGRALTSITIPNSVTSIGNQAFQNCTSLTSITLPDGVTSIGNLAFEYCTSLTSITLPDGITSIGYYTFQGCRSLTSITIPDGVTSIGTSAFYDCTGLTSITFKNTNGWKDSNGNPVSVADPEAAATLLKQGYGLTRSN